jgi:hypothetical protein
MPVNKFKLKAALADLDAKGIEVGDVVKVEWSVDAAYGGGTRSHAGPLKSIDRDDGWFEVAPSNKSPGHLRSSLTAMSATMTKLEGDEAANVRREAAQGPAKKKSGRTDSKVATDNPFVAKAKKKDNPFMKKK